MMMTRDQIIATLRKDEALPKLGPRDKAPNHRTIYQSGEGPRLRPSGHFFIDYAAYPGGSQDEVPIELIRQLETEGVIVRAFPDKPEIEAWILTEIITK